MRRIPFFAFMLVVLLAVSGLTGYTAFAANHTFSATLSGAADNVQTPARGSASFELNDHGTQLSYTLNVSDIQNVTMAHIHLGAAGQNGPIVVWLYPKSTSPMLIPGTFNGELAHGTITAADLTGPLAGKPLSALIDAMQKGNTYVNVHTERYPNGEIRGQIK